MRRLAPALGGRVTRRNIVLSPHVWTATGTTFGVYAISNAVIAFTTTQFDRTSLLVLAAVLAVIAAVVFASRPPEPGSLASHALLSACYLASVGAVIAFAPHGSSSVIAGLVTGPLLSIWLRNRWQIIAHLTVMSLAYLAAATLVANDGGTLFAVLCFLPASWLVTAACVLVLDALERQGEEHEQLAMRDPLTGAGNAAFLDDMLKVELTRHRSAGQPLALLELRLADFDAVNGEIGRAAGDGVLTLVACALRDLAPATASVARTSGDEFTVLLPTTDPEQAATFLQRARAQLARIDAGSEPLAVAAGMAHYPGDAAKTRELRNLASARAGAAAAVRGARSHHPGNLRELSTLDSELPALPQVAPAGTPSTDAPAGEGGVRIGRPGIARDRAVLRCTGFTFLLYGALALGAQLAGLLSSDPMILAVLLATFAFGIAHLVVRPPEIGTRLNHLAIGSTWVLPICAMVACAPHASWAASTTVFSAPVIATRLTDRRQIAAHLILSSGAMLAMIGSGVVDLPSILAILTLLLSSWVLALCTVTIFEAAEEQASRMTELVLRDPLTGAGNARLLRERLLDELPRHDDMQMPLAVVDVDLAGLQALRDREGGGRAADALRHMAVRLATASGPDATVARTSDNRFSLLLPLTDAEDARPLVARLRRETASVSHPGQAIHAKVGVAAFPDDGASGDALLELAASRADRDDPSDHRLMPTDDPLDLPFPVRRQVRRPIGEPSAPERSVG